MLSCVKMYMADADASTISDIGIGICYVIALLWEWEAAERVRQGRPILWQHGKASTFLSTFDDVMSSNWFREIWIKHLSCTFCVLHPQNAPNSTNLHRYFQKKLFGGETPGPQAWRDPLPRPLSFGVRTRSHFFVFASPRYTWLESESFWAGFKKNRLGPVRWKCECPLIDFLFLILYVQKVTMNLALQLYAQFCCYYLISHTAKLCKLGSLI